MKNRDDNRLIGKVVVAIGGIVIALCIGEVLLRASGFSYRLYPSEVQFGWPDPVTMLRNYEVDEYRLWVPKHYSDRLNALRARRPSIVFMGDSCTEFGSYDRDFAALFARDHPGIQLAGANLGVGGWSTYQGLQQLRRDVVPLSPELITIYFGWNDHWTSFGIEDRRIGQFNLARSPLLIRASKLRIVQLMNRAYVRRWQRRLYDERRPERVSLSDFEHNLSQMVQIAREHGIVPVLLTAPSSHVRGHEPVYLAERWLNDLGDLVAVHQRYVEAVRKVGRQRDVLVVDLARILEDLQDREPTSKLFREDGLHPTRAGDAEIVRALYGALRQHGLLARLGRPGGTSGPPLPTSD